MKFELDSLSTNSTFYYSNSAKKVHRIEIHRKVIPVTMSNNNCYFVFHKIYRYSWCFYKLICIVLTFLMNEMRISVPSAYDPSLESFTDFNFPFVFKDHEMFCVCTYAFPGRAEPPQASFLPLYKKSRYKNARSTKTLTLGDKCSLFIIFVYVVWWLRLMTCSFVVCSGLWYVLVTSRFVNGHAFVS